MNEEQIRDILEKAFAEMRVENPQLKIESIGERAFCFRLGLKIANKFDGYVLDSEYNLDIGEKDSKRITVTIWLDAKPITREKLAIPDFIVHKRNSSKEDNLLVIEAKWADAKSNEVTFASEKLELIKEKFGYKHAVLLSLPRAWEKFSKERDITFIPISS